MPNGHGQRREDEEELIAKVEKDGWDHFANPSDWIVDAARSDGVHHGTGNRSAIYYGDNYVYKVVSSVHGTDVHVFSREKE